MTLVLLGYMGSGKSSIARNLSKLTNFDYLDLDDYIVKQEGKSIPELFEERGEIYFRKLEAKYLKELLNRERIIISLGGGTPCYGHNMLFIVNSNVTSVYLRAKVTTLTQRIFPERMKRPMVSHLDSKDELSEFVGKHLFERSKYYNMANVVIDTDSKSVTEISQEIVAKLF